MVAAALGLAWSCLALPCLALPCPRSLPCATVYFLLLRRRAAHVTAHFNEAKLKRSFKLFYTVASVYNNALLENRSISLILKVQKFLF